MVPSAGGLLLNWDWVEWRGRRGRALKLGFLLHWPVCWGGGGKCATVCVCKTKSVCKSQFSPYTII